MTLNREFRGGETVTLPPQSDGVNIGNLTMNSGGETVTDHPK
jgi:hypothetical protein